MKLGTGNILKGKVVEIEKGMIMTKVKVDIRRRRYHHRDSHRRGLERIRRQSGGRTGGSQNHRRHGAARYLH